VLAANNLKEVNTSGKNNKPTTVGTSRDGVANTNKIQVKKTVEKAKSLTQQPKSRKTLKQQNQEKKALLLLPEIAAVQ